MGGGMGRSLLRASHVVHGFDINDKAVLQFVADGGETGALPDVAKWLDFLVTVVVNAAQMESVLFGERGVAPLLAKGTVVIGCATVAPDFARSTEARLAELGVLYVDAPMSGGAAKAADGALTMMVGATPEAMSKAEPVLASMAQKIFRLGDRAGAGSAMKIVNQMLAGVHIASMAEAITFAMTQGVEPRQFMDVIPQCAGSSWMLENRGPHVVDGDYTPRSAVEIFVKDLGIVSDIARGVRFSAPLTAAALQQFLAASGMGYGGEDDAAVAKVYARNARLKLPGE